MIRKCWLLAVALMVSSPVIAQAPDTKDTLAKQSEAMKVLNWMDGEWRGQALFRTPQGEFRITQTERVGPLLGGSIKVIEGHAYDPTGATPFNALAVIHYDTAAKTYSLTSFANGNRGVFPLMPTSNGFKWEIKSGPMLVRYEAVIKDGRWTETGDHIVDGKPPFRMYEMTLDRLRDSEWPKGGAVPAR